MTVKVSVAAAHHGAKGTKCARFDTWFARVTYALVALKLLASVLLSDQEGVSDTAFSILPKVIDALILLAAISGLVVAPSTKRKWRIVGSALALVILAAATQIISGRSMTEAAFTLAKLMAPLLLLAACVLNFGSMGSTGASRSVVWWVLALVAVGLFVIEPTFRNGREWAPAYFSGTHTSAYVAVFTIALAVLAMARNWWRDSLVLPILVLMFMVVVGWGVRTAIVGGIIAVAYVLFKRATPQLKFLFLMSMLTVGLLALLVLFSSGGITLISLEELSSGRTTEWLNRVGRIGSRSIVQLLLGTGVGSNVTYSSVWWWELKDSHNDFLAIIYDQGLVGLVAVIALLRSAYMLRPPSVAWNAVWLMYLSSSLLSNGLMFRPTAAGVFVLAALAAHRSGFR